MADKWTDSQRRCGKVLLECLASGQYEITYLDLVRRMHMPDSYAHLVGKRDLGPLTKWCLDHGLPTVSVMAVNSDPSDKYHGIFDGLLSIWIERGIMQRYGNDFSRCLEGVQQELRECSSWQILADSLGIALPGAAKQADGQEAPAIPQEPETPDPLASVAQTEHIEGAAVQVTSTAYERDPAARAACLRHYGAVCQICGFDAAKVYGAEFAGLIRVHHITPLAETAGAHAVDPIRDLIPVCPNCHMILHAKPGGVYTPAELRALMHREKS